MDLLENQMAAESVDIVFQDLEAMLMRNIIRHCQDYDQPIATDTWLLQKLAEIGRLDQENIKLIAQMTGISQTAMERMLNESADEALKQVEPALAYLTREGLTGKPVKLRKSKSVQNTMKDMKAQAKSTLNLCNTNMLYKAREAYQKLVNKVAADASEIADKQSFLNRLNVHGTAVTIGAESRQQAMRRCIEEFNDKGIPAFVDKRGREWTPEAYVNMAMRNTAKNTADEVQTARCRDYGVNLIEIDSHSGARPKCAKDQGKIYDLNNGSGYTTDAKGRKVQYYPWNSTSYGEPDGILGINCRHHKYPFFPGMSLQTYFPVEDQEASDRLYKQTQVQRALERDVRKQKRECMLYKELGDDEAFEQSAVKLKAKEARLQKYVGDNDQLHRRKDREQVVGFDRKISAEAVAINKAYTKALNTDKIPLKDTIIHRSVGAKFKNYKVVDKATGVEYEFAAGSRIQNSEVFAGKGTKHPLHEGVAEGLTEQYGGKTSEWQHAKGYGTLIDPDTGEELSAEVHWFQEKSVGKVKFKVKEWLDEG